MAQHPGEILRTAFLEPLGLAPARLAAGLGVDRGSVSRVLRGQRPITPEMAAKLGAYFSVPARWWLAMQAEYDAELVDGRPDLVKGVTPLPPNLDVLLTPKGVLRLDLPAEPKPRGPRTVRYENGAVALLSGDEP